MTLAAEPAARSSTLDANPLSNLFQIWANDPSSATRVGRYRIGSRSKAVAPASFSNIFTFTRASKGQDFDPTGTLTELAIDAIRQGYDPVTLLPAGWLIEGASTNGVRNPRCEGAVLGIAGAGGVGGTNILIADPRASGITAEIVGIGGEAGIGGIDVRYYGTATASTGIRNTHENNNIIVAASGQTWTHSGFVRLLAGALNGATLQFELREFATGVAGSLAGQVFTSGSGALAAQRYSYTRTLADAGTTHVTPSFRLGVSNGVTYDFTLRFGGFQCEQNYYASSLALPAIGSPAATLRSPDNLSIAGNQFSQIFGNGAPAGFVICDVLMDVTAPTGGAVRMFAQIDDGSAANRLQLRTNSGATNVVGVTTLAGAQGAAPSAGSAVYGTPMRAGIRWNGGAFSVCANGGALASGTGAPVGVFTALRLGADSAGAANLNGRSLGAWAGPYSPSDLAFQNACVYGTDVATALRS